jgi:S1-C subfamily serine protease
MKTRLALLSCCVLVTAGTPVRGAPEDSVVKVVATLDHPDPRRPWAKGNAGESGGTGVVIEGNRILTNAHVVLYAREVFVQARPDDERFEAKIQALARDVDLAVLTVKDERFFTKKPPLARADRLPRVQDPVAIFGFPIGGNELSVTKGEISRLDFKNYGIRGPGTVIQISAAVNPGNSGGPAVVADKMVGLVQSVHTGAQNIGYIIPNEEIETLLDDLKDGRYDGKAFDVSGAAYQTTENPALRRMLQLDANVTGVLVHPPRRPRPEFPFQPFDIVTKIGEHAIDNAGKVPLAGGRRAPFQYFIAKLAHNSRVPLTVWRGGEHVRVLLPVSTRDDRLIPDYDGTPLPYFIHGPLVFAAARREDIMLYAQLNRYIYWDNSPLTTRSNDFVSSPGEELVVVSAPLFKHKIAKGYFDPVGKVVEQVNGTRVKNLKHVVEALRDGKDAFVTIRFADDWSETLVFLRQEMERATEEILEENGIAATRRGSAELLKLWKANAKPAP